MTTRQKTDTLPQGTRIGRTALRASDLGELTAFYRDVVGLSVQQQSESTAVLGVDETPLLVLERDADTPERQRSGAGLYHNAFRVPSRKALGDALTRIRDRWQLSGASDHLVSEALYLRDPEGNGVEIYRDFPREEWPITDEGTVHISTEPLDLESVEAAAAGDDRAPPGTDVGHVHLEVTSLDAFEEFYVDTLGFEVQTTVPAAYFVSAGGYHHHIGANTWNQRTSPVGGRGLSWFEVVLPDTETFEAIRNRLTDAQVAVSERDAGFVVEGPDGIDVRFRAES
ncbi:glyoxalase [Haloprofundus marisrubri]|uniref:Glyoxalase n=1 Tax=Haloprofundus marisrubri TaxID=1514971 RepID=A0A0W1RFW5_9EURY|nr:VOC family protein [Haloprofundus marisrubri]KTG11556.1 glyoxalase [Haloprofundus marisrubri]